MNRCSVYFIKTNEIFAYKRITNSNFIEIGRSNTEPIRVEYDFGDVRYVYNVFGLYQFDGPANRPYTKLFLKPNEVYIKIVHNYYQYEIA
jgi:hypothetical protein